MSPTYIAYFLAWKILGFLPESTAYGLMRWLADQITKRNPSGVQRLRSNYLRVHPEYSEQQLQAAVKEGMRSYLRYWCDTFRFPLWSSKEIISRVTLVNEHYLRDALAEGKGAVVSLPHAGNWDHAGAYYCEMGWPIVSVAEHLEPERLFKQFLAYRESIGMEVLDADVRSLAILAQRLRQGRLLALVADRDLTKSGVTVDSLAILRVCRQDPAVLSIKTGSPFLTAFVRYTDIGIEISFGPQIPIPASGTQSEKVEVMIQESATRLEGNLRNHLTDWHMLQRIWIDGDFKERE
ncbi:MAG: phosphatidylinositol mannoside acyltransferase [Actinomycetota bacterium]